MSKFIWIILTFLAGAMLPIQGGMNAKLGKSITSPVYASMISFVVGAAVLIAYILVTKQAVNLSGIRTAPAYVWLAGALGAFYVTVVILAFPRIGPALTFGLVVAGQMAIAVTLEHFNVLVAQQHSISIWRVVGMIMILIGVVIIRKF
jgi:bacterial/archaeal transporter family-2 protein